MRTKEGFCTLTAVTKVILIKSEASKQFKFLNSERVECGHFVNMFFIQGPFNNLLARLENYYLG
jgi:hypothetical protein